MIPHVTQFDEADITELEAFRVALNKENEKAGIKVTMLAFLIKASVAALKKFPDVNAFPLDGDNLVLKQYFHIGFAADTPNGLVVPVIKNADQKGVLAIAGEMTRALREGARRQARPGRHAGRLLLHFEPGRHRRHGVHADHQRAGSRDPRRVEERHEAGVGRQGLRAATHGCRCRFSYDHRVIDGAGGGALHRLSRGAARRHAPGDAMSVRRSQSPDIGDFKDIPVIEVFVKPGDKVAAEDSLVTLESDKATMDVPSPAARRRQGSEGEARRQGERRLADRRARIGRRRSQRREGSRAARATAHPPPPPRRRRPPRRRAEACSRRCRQPADSRRRYLHRQGGCRMPDAGAGRRTGRLQRRVPRGRPRHEDGAGRALRRRWAACASTSAAFRRRRCCTSPP